MKILTFSTLYPNSRQASHGIFVENRLRQLLGYAPEVEARVIAPVPWFPFKHPLFGEYAKFAGVEKTETRHGIDVVHPRYLVIPKIGMGWTPGLLYRAVRPYVQAVRDQGFDFDLIDAHYFYPDGIAAMRLAQEFGRPFTVTGRGTDLNLIPQYAGPREQILEVTREAAHMMTVAGALKDYLREMGVADDRATVLRNGVDLNFFQPPSDRSTLREAVAYTQRPTLLSVGHLIERKGHHLVIEAMQQLPEFDLVIAGDGPEAAALKQLVERMGVQSQVTFAGRLGQEALRQHYQAADALVLASSREGWANVLLEAMACGTPVVATPVDGTPEVVAAPAAGRLTPDRSAAGVAASVKALFADLPERAATRAYAEGFSWDETSQGQLDIFRRAIAAGV
ncbi:glycosyltransferase [Thiosocius teredinicola]|uniref:glycosyltransferase n=1 Tax=Thiosocius teredinicola TaxID=1973002 RepID=UPI0009911F98